MQNTKQKFKICYLSEAKLILILILTGWKKPVQRQNRLAVY